MFARFIFIGLCISLFVCCSKTASEKPFPSNACHKDLEADEIEVTSLAAASLIKQNFPEGKTPVIINSTIANDSSYRLPERLKLENKRFPNIDPGVIEDFELRNQTSRSFDKVLKLPQKYEYISGKEWEELGDKRNYYLGKPDPIAKKFPDSAGLNAVVGFSRAGFNEDFSKAVIFAFRWYDHDSFFFLEKENCEWKIKQEEIVGFH